MHKNRILYLMACCLTLTAVGCQQRQSEEESIASTHPKLEKQLEKRDVATPVSDQANAELYTRYRITLEEYQQNNAYQVSKPYIGQMAPLNPTGLEEKYKPYVVAALQQGINFAGKYTVATAPCGENCQMHFVVDRETGNLVESVQSSTGAYFKKNSRIFVLNPPDATGKPAGCSTCRPEMYEITNEKLRKLPHDAH